jgi:hypothetical protein
VFELDVMFQIALIVSVVLWGNPQPAWDYRIWKSPSPCSMSQVNIPSLGQDWNACLNPCSTICILDGERPREFAVRSFMVENNLELLSPHPRLIFIYKDYFVALMYSTTENALKFDLNLYRPMLSYPYQFDAYPPIKCGSLHRSSFSSRITFVH